MRALSILFSVFFSVFSSLPSIGFAQMKASSDSITLAALTSQLPFDLNSSWLITVVGSDRTLTLQLSGGTKQGDTGKVALNAALGLPRLQPLPISAEMIETAQGRTLSLITRLGGKVVASQNPDGTFNGTITDANGQSRAVSIRKLAETELAALQPQREAGFSVKPVAADVPVACAAFIGGWTGNWGYGKRWLWIGEIDAKCVVKFIYGTQQKPSGKIQSAEIKDGKFAFPCGGAGGTCYFTNHGDELWAGYGGSDGQNSTVFQKESAAASN